jgi:hypothetical protein
MVRAALFVACCCMTLLGCQSVPLNAVSDRPQPVEPWHTIPLFGGVVADREAIRQVAARQVPPGTPLAEARAILEQQGFRCRNWSIPTAIFIPTLLVPPDMDLPSDVQKLLAKERDSRSVYCRADVNDQQEWHLQSYTVLVILLPDEKDAVHDLIVGVHANCNRYTNYFRTKPELHEPIGLPIAEAQARMASAGFRCKANGPHVLCEAFDEHILGGYIVRVHLCADDAGIVRSTKVPDSENLFDAERCMLPHGDESTSEAVCRGVLFPVRAGCRYSVFALGAVAICMAITAMPYGLH